MKILKILKSFMCDHQYREYIGQKFCQDRFNGKKLFIVAVMKKQCSKCGKIIDEHVDTTKVAK